MRTHPQLQARQRTTPAVDLRAPRRRYPIIADHGDSAWLVVLDDDLRPWVGMRFRFQGRTWEITRDRTPARTFVAEPLCH